MADDGEGKKRKKTRKEKLAEQREFDRSLGLSKGIGVKYDKVADRHMDGELCCFKVLSNTSSLVPYFNTR